MDFSMFPSDSNDISNNSGVYYIANNNNASTPSTTSSHLPLSPSSLDNTTALSRLSDNLASIFDSTSDSDFFADAKIVLHDDQEVSVHRCILSARSSYFKKIFMDSAAHERGGKVKLKELAKDYDVGMDALKAVIGYMYSGKMKPLPKGVCVCVDDDCSHIGCRPVVDFMVQVLYASSTFQIPELVALYQRHLLDILDKVAVDDILVVLSVANICGKMCERLKARCSELIAVSDIDLTTLEKALSQALVKEIMDKSIELGLNRPERFNCPNKHVKKIHKALDSDDVELVRMLLREGHTDLDEAYALHYAVAYCDLKITTELLDLGLADVNQKNRRGYSVLHIAAMRKEPKIIVSLLTKGAHPSDLTLDGRKALQISKRLTKAVDYYKSTEEGNISSKDRLCIEILEQAERREPLLGEASLSLAMAGDDFRMKLLYLENRVGLAKFLFPMEANVVRGITQIDNTSEDTYSPNMGGSHRTTVDLNEAPFKIKEEHLIRMRALSRTVELGKRMFPRCTGVLDKIMDVDDLSQLICMGNDSPEERQMKRRRYMELQDVLSQAFNEDKEEFGRSGVSSSPSSTSIGVKGKARRVS